MTMTSVSRGPARRRDLSPAVALFRSLGDPARLAIVHELAHAECRVVDLTHALSLAQSTVSAHLACMAECGLVESRAVGRASMYRLVQPALVEVLAAAEELLAATGNAVDLCPVHGDRRGPASPRSRRRALS